jgi:hypothetical protein
VVEVSETLVAGAVPEVVVMVVGASADEVMLAPVEPQPATEMASSRTTDMTTVSLKIRKTPPVRFFPLLAHG